MNTTLPNANTTGAPLMLGEYISVYGFQEFYLATVATYPYVTTSANPSLAMSGGNITANAVQSTALTSATSGSFLQFTANFNGPVDPVSGFCGILEKPGDPYPLLAINGRTDVFSICSDGQFDAVVYNATEGSAAYDVGTCYAVTLNMVATAT
ncbi:hypothetical protein OE88DRAFT_1668067 [Heliocybe sulcata]|uniref:Ubiquitin 3 binding protein But2 C-terminal domain-containing protein n=1 Tax=Heliocybe sulcata TaxID=5364 RepID=A0A5C3MQ75_9AGAM|nr:hypothetical protein OE88DRAFT_1668067 [Heliocybe sulcata]